MPPGEPLSSCGVGSGPSALPEGRGAVPAESGPPGAAARGGPSARGAGAAGRGRDCRLPGVPPASAPDPLGTAEVRGGSGGPARGGSGSVFFNSAIVKKKWPFFFSFYFLPKPH